MKQRLLGEESVSDYDVFVPQGLFSSPTKREKEFKEGYAWYFRDPTSGNEMIAPDKDRMQVFVDMPAYGKSDNVGFDWTLEDCVTVVVPILNELKIQRCVVIGQV